MPIATHLLGDHADQSSVAMAQRLGNYESFIPVKSPIHVLQGL